MKWTSQLTQQSHSLTRTRIFQRYYESSMFILDLIGVMPVGWLDWLVPPGTKNTLIVFRCLKALRFFRLNRLLLGNSILSMEGTVGHPYRDRGKQSKTHATLHLATLRLTAPHPAPCHPPLLSFNLRHSNSSHTLRQGSIRSLLTLYFIILLATHIFSSILSVIALTDPESTWLENEVSNTIFDGARLYEMQRDFAKQYVIDPSGVGAGVPSRSNAMELYLVGRGEGEGAARRRERD